MTEESVPLFSIIIPAYNAEEYLPESLASIGRQTCDDYELVLIDDGSTDGTLSVFEAYSSSHGNVAVLSGPNRGLLLARRRGLRHCRGEYVVFVDADDSLRNDAFETLARAIESSHADIISYGFTRRKDDWRSNSTGNQPKGLYSGDDMDEVRAYTCLGAYNSLWSKAIRRGCFDIAADYSSYAGVMHGEDLLQLLPAMDASRSFLAIDETLYFYRPSENASTARFKPRQLEDIARVCERMLAFGKKWGKECYQAALVGEVRQYLYLLKIIALEQASVAKKLSEVQLLSDVMEREGVFARARAAELRLDWRAKVFALRKGMPHLALLLVHGVDVAGRVRDEIVYRAAES